MDKLICLVVVRGVSYRDMKTFSLVSVFLVVGFLVGFYAHPAGVDVSPVSAANCALPGEIFNSSTGVRCTAPTPCQSGQLFNSTTGRSCPIPKIVINLPKGGETLTEGSRYSFEFTDPGAQKGDVYTVNLSSSSGAIVGAIVTLTNNTDTKNFRSVWKVGEYGPVTAPKNLNLTKKGRYTIQVVKKIGSKNSTYKSKTFTITPPAATGGVTNPTTPTITVLQGYDAATGIYDRVTGRAVAGKYLVLWGKFAASGNTVKVGDQNYTPTFQSATQINVLLGSTTGTFQVTVSNANGTSGASRLTVSAPGAGPGL